MQWWWATFDIVEEGGEEGVRRRTAKEVEEEIKEWDKLEREAEGKGKGKGKKSNGKGKDTAPSFLHPLRPNSIPPSSSINSALSRAAISISGTRDDSSLLFTALCRALDIPARMVFSLQPVEWRTPPKSKREVEEGEGKGGTGAKGKGKGKGKSVKKGKAKATGKGTLKPLIESESDEEEDDDEEAEEDEEGFEGKRSGVTPAVRLRKSRSSTKSNNNATSDSPGPSSSLLSPFPLPPTRAELSSSCIDSDAYDMRRPPVFWTEIYHRTLRKWVPVDPVRNKIDCAGIMQPKGIVSNKMAYVVAFEEGEFISLL